MHEFFYKGGKHMSQQKKGVITWANGREVPLIGQGTWHMGEKASLRQEEVRALQLGLDLGMTLVDTAEMYAEGSAEEIVGEAIRGRRDQVYLVLTPRLYDPSEDRELLKLGYGFTNIVSQPTRGVEDIAREEYAEGRLKLYAKLKEYRPKVACFVGKGVYTEYSKKSKADWGFQPEPLIPEVHEFVAPSSSGLVRMPLEDITDIYRRLQTYLTAEIV
jgi:TDG/mug DNA glycosylase family protein